MPRQATGSRRREAGEDGPAVDPIEAFEDAPDGPDHLEAATADQAEDLISSEARIALPSTKPERERRGILPLVLIAILGLAIGFAIMMLI